MNLLARITGASVTEAAWIELIARREDLLTFASLTGIDPLTGKTVELGPPPTKVRVRGTDGILGRIWLAENGSGNLFVQASQETREEMLGLAQELADELGGEFVPM